MQIKRSMILFVAAFNVVFGFLTIATPLFAATTEKVLHNFSSSSTDGISPNGGLIIDVAGNLYGTTYEGGDHNYGTVFQLTPGTNGTWNEKVLYSFNNNGTDGAYPRASLIFDAAGNLYGTTNGGGANAWGTVFQLTPGTGGTWTEKVLYSFNGTSGGSPFGSLISDTAGNLYGTTYQGGGYTTCSGSYGCGTAFELTRSKGTWTEKILHSFNNNGKDGFNPYANLIFDKAGNLYGTTYQGGAYTTCSGTYGCGTVFELIRAAKGQWTEKLLHSFNYNGKDGFNPTYGGLIFDKAGKLCGMTFWGVGAYVTDCSESCGTAFQLTR